MLRFRAWSVAAMLACTGLAAPAVANTQMLPVEGPWAPNDYVTAIFAVQNGKITLPRRGNPKTEAFFDRLIDRGNIDQLMAGTESASLKRQQILLILSATGEFRGRYGYAVALGDDVENELIDIQIFRLALIDRLALIEEAQACCGSAIATTLHGTLDTLADARTFPNDRLIMLAQALEASYPVIRPKLARPDQDALITRLEGLMAREADPGLHSALAAVLKAAIHGN
jgi:hypothetical protein